MTLYKISPARGINYYDNNQVTNYYQVTYTMTTHASITIHLCVISSA